MLEGLFGNQTVQKVLLFLFVNRTCYGSQLARSLSAPLTPLQKALNRLEKGGIVVSHFQGKTKLYELNSAYPLIHELEALLKAAYTLLPALEKKVYYAVQDSFHLTPHTQLTTIQILSGFWERLLTVKHLSLNARSQSKDLNGWNGSGSGEVKVQREGDYALLFLEKGSWKGKTDQQMGFSNALRWTFDRGAGVLSLEHLRRGVEEPVFLFHLAPYTERVLTSVDAHLCGGDAYFGQLHLDRQGLRLNWRVIGPKKNEEINYYYN